MRTWSELIYIVLVSVPYSPSLSVSQETSYCACGSLEGTGATCLGCLCFLHQCLYRIDSPSKASVYTALFCLQYIASSVSIHLTPSSACPYFHHRLLIRLQVWDRLRKFSRQKMAMVEAKYVQATVRLSWFDLMVPPPKQPSTFHTWTSAI